jgi:hypothetical protein
MSVWVNADKVCVDGVKVWSLEFIYIYDKRRGGALILNVGMAS